jgi:hypothetical protein
VGVSKKRLEPVALPVPDPERIVPSDPATLLSVPTRENSPTVKVWATGVAEGARPKSREAAARRERRVSTVANGDVLAFVKPIATLAETLKYEALNPK